MAMAKRGLVKACEEAAEFIQAATKKMARMDHDDHWDGTVSLKERMELELGDFYGASRLVVKNFDLDIDRIMRQAESKFQLFLKWDSEPEESGVFISETDYEILKRVTESLSNLGINLAVPSEASVVEKAATDLAHVVNNICDTPVEPTKAIGFRLHEEHGGRDPIG